MAELHAAPCLVHQLCTSAGQYWHPAPTCAAPAPMDEGKWTQGQSLLQITGKKKLWKFSPVSEILKWKLKTSRSKCWEENHTISTMLGMAKYHPHNSVQTHLNLEPKFPSLFFQGSNKFWLQLEGLSKTAHKNKQKTKTTTTKITKLAPENPLAVCFSS